MKYYDFEEVRTIIEHEKLKGLLCAQLGMREDWFWTGTTVWDEELGYDEEIFQAEEVGGINGSSWATPILRLTYEGRDDYEELEIYIFRD